ncbi:hypothetical protein GCK72_023357 [Caenorhabditis remanei]|uniref:Uncharacterized protein n=1 Tax=Caenorhabditis remanei TaxID=31234 RepID=A0A6A5FWX7_CAERE|nr:hypothetical protein GCK72_023357 [Caenorhabditis remanei]KAF1746899.1 hypothetical protein GCK72_023357 [Caenorhabditis remanei]
MTQAEEVISYLINSIVGLSSASSKQFRAYFRDADPGEPDTLLCLCIKWLFKNGDFSEFYDGIKPLVKGKSLADFTDSHLMRCPELMKFIVAHADNKSRKNKFSIKKDEFSLCVGRGRLITVPFTEDMKEPATLLADYTKLLFSFKNYDIEYAFEGCYGLHRNMDLSQNHIKLLSKLTPDLFAEKGTAKFGRERNGRLAVRMSRISWLKSGIYYNAIIQLFESLRGTVILQGEQPECEKPVTFNEILQHTLAHPGKHLLDDKPNLQWSCLSMKKKRKE